MGKQDRRSLPGVRESFLWEGEPSLPQPGGVGASSPQPEILEGCRSCVLPLLSEPQIGGQGRGWVKRGREGSAQHCHSHLSLSLFSLRAPRTAASCNLGPARQGWGRRPTLLPHLMPTPALHLTGRGSKPKKNTPLFFLLCFVFCFSKRSYFLQWFYTEGKT